MLEKFILVKAVLESFRRFKKYLSGSGLEYIHFTGFKTISYAILAGVQTRLQFTVYYISGLFHVTYLMVPQRYNLLISSKLPTN